MPVQLPAGDYYIGDPCYAIQPWHDYLDQAFPGYGDKLGPQPFLFGGLQCVVYSTEYGDGTYSDQNGNYYCVDSGLIGATPLSVCDRERDYFRGLGYILSTPTPILCSLSLIHI